jgi:hypothetical protein
VPEPEGDAKPFAYALLRVVPRLDRGERVNVGVALYCRQRDFLDLRTHLDAGRLNALDPQLDLDAVAAQIGAIATVLCGDPQGGALANLPGSERFGWLVAPSSTIIQPSEVHTGLTHDPAATLEHLFCSLVM